MVFVHKWVLCSSVLQLFEYRQCKTRECYYSRADKYPEGMHTAPSCKLLWCFCDYQHETLGQCLHRQCLNPLLCFEVLIPSCMCPLLGAASVVNHVALSEMDPPCRSGVSHCEYTHLNSFQKAYQPHGLQERHHGFKCFGKRLSQQKLNPETSKRPMATQSPWVAQRRLGKRHGLRQASPEQCA